jgi:alpha-L-arabinofuranosidase
MPVRKLYPALMLALACLGACRQLPEPDAVLRLEETESTAGPISPYVYGQFIEHLGRCIYGGIWAEMLEDRKFYYPVTDNYAPWGSKTDEYWKAGAFEVLEGSPWKVVGSAGTVDMDTRSAFTGSHSPIVKLQGAGAWNGISQDRISLESGKAYTGRIWLRAGPEVEAVRLRVDYGNGADMQAIAEFSSIPDSFSRFDFQFTATGATGNAVLEITGTGAGSFGIGAVSLMPADNLQGFRPDVIALLKELDAPVYRWPGGNFVSGYNWRDGIGDPDRRPPRKNPAWTGIEHNDVGLHEFMQLCRLLGTEPYVAVNTGLGTVEEVAEEVSYCNSPADTPLGAQRAANGDPEPFDIKFWAVGNEMYGEWQLGHMPLEEYVKKHMAMAGAMRAADPSIELVAVGSVGDWSRTMLTECSAGMDYLSEHIYCQEKEDAVAHSAQLADEIRRVAQAHRAYRAEIPGLAELDIRLAMDEWNYWYGDYIYGELGCRYYWKDGIGVARGLHEFFRNSDLYYMANYAQTVNVIGAIKTTGTAAEFESTGMVLKLYRQHYGSAPLAIACPDSALDVHAALAEDGGALTLSVVNPGPDARRVALDAGAAGFDKRGLRYRIAAEPGVYNEPGQPRRLEVEEGEADMAVLEIAPYSVNIYRFPVR